MAFPSVSARTQGSTAASTSPSITIPTGSMNQLLLAVVSAHGNPTVDWNGINWVQLVQDLADDTISIGYRWTDGSEGSSISPTLNVSAETAYSVLRITNALHPALGGLWASTIAEGVSTGPNADSLAPGGGQRPYLWIFAGNTNNGNRIYTAAPANYSNLNAADSASAGTGTAVATAERLLSAASEDPGAATISVSTAWKAYTIAVAPMVSLLSRQSSIRRNILTR